MLESFTIIENHVYTSKKNIMFAGFLYFASKIGSIRNRDTGSCFAIFLHILPQILGQLEIVTQAHLLQVFLYILPQKLGQLEIMIKSHILKGFLYILFS